mmetsp:Transcript_51423/g.137239  ORF Transcript_51423/g.137239 Transcript_51423/m.137239 type:complete len:222 (-) Transcript_51423:865-1530(-)
MGLRVQNESIQRQHRDWQVNEQRILQRLGAHERFLGVLLLRRVYCHVNKAGEAVRRARVLVDGLKNFPGHIPVGRIASDAVEDEQGLERFWTNSEIPLRGGDFLSNTGNVGRQARGRLVVHLIAGLGHVDSGGQPPILPVLFRSNMSTESKKSPHETGEVLHHMVAGKAANVRMMPSFAQQFLPHLVHGRLELLQQLSICTIALNVTLQQVLVVRIPIRAN